MNCCNADGKCQSGHGCPADVAKVAKHKPLDGGNVWYSEPLAEPMTRLDRVFLVVAVGICTGLFYGAVRFYMEVLS